MRDAALARRDDALETMDGWHSHTRDVIGAALVRYLQQQYDGEVAPGQDVLTAAPHFNALSLLQHVDALMDAHQPGTYVADDLDGDIRVITNVHDATVWFVHAHARRGTPALVTIAPARGGAFQVITSGGVRRVEVLGDALCWLGCHATRSLLEAADRCGRDRPDRGHARSS